jgi:hypothetical protein
MQRTPYRCPECSVMLTLSSDMWGPYYLCATCGWTCEDDDSVSGAVVKPGFKGPFPTAYTDLPSATRHRRPPVPL